MTNPNPFLPQGSLLELQNRRRSRLKLVVFCALAVSVTGLVTMLIQGCHREKPTDELNPPPLDLTNTSPVVDTNLPPPTNNLVMTPSSLAPTNNFVTPMPAPLPTPTPEPPAAGSTYTIAKGDTLAKVAKANHVSLKALQDANPGVTPTKLKVGQKINLPAGGSSSASAATSAMTDSGNTYTVKPGDTLAKIAKAEGVSLKALQNANPGVVPTKLKVGQKLNLPVKTSAPAPDVVPAPATLPPPTTSAAPMLPPPTTPAPGTAPAH